MANTTTISFLGHATLLFETLGGRRILLDPFLIGNPSTPAKYKSVEALGKLDAILVTHLHNDHCMEAVAAAKANPSAPLIAMVEATDWFDTKGAPKTIGMNKGGEIHLEGVTISMTPASHSSSFTLEDGSSVYGGEAAGFVLSIENGPVIYAAGDTTVFGDMALIRELYAPSLAILPIGDHYTMGPRLAAHAVRLLGVHDVIPVHYGTFPPLVGTPEQLEHFLGPNSGVTVHPLHPGESMTL